MVRVSIKSDRFRRCEHLRAEEMPLDRTIFTVSPEIYAEYFARLDAPVKPNERLRRTMSTKAPWDEA
jgi:uncharacterized protein (DUF1778 family)